jgi:plastocyanin
LRNKLRLTSALALAFLTSCTNGGIPVSTGGSGGIAITVNLTLNQPQPTPYGVSAGYAPPVTTVAVGSQIRFTNTDSFTHTATLIPNATKFPSGSPFTAKALQQSGNNLSGGFSSGAMLAGTGSQTINVDRAGTYFFGCFFHYSSPSNMRGVIVAQ